MVTETKSSLKISRDALAIEQETFNKMNDSLIPVLVPNVCLEFNNASGIGFRYSITIDNHGPGVAFIQEINARDEIDVSRLYNNNLRTAVVQPGTQIRGSIITGNSEIFSNKDKQYVSSWSLWYTDVYGQWFRSTVFIKYQNSGMTEEGEFAAADVIGREFYRNVIPCSLTFEVNKQTSSLVTQQENGRAVIYNPDAVDFYLPSKIQHKIGREYEGSGVTGNRPVFLLDISFWALEWPCFELRVENHTPFILTKARYLNNDGTVKKLDVYIWAKENFKLSQFGRFNFRTSHRIGSFPALGLVQTADMDNKLLELYESVLSQLKI